MTGTFQTLPRQFRCSTFKTTPSHNRVQQNGGSSDNGALTNQNCDLSLSNGGLRLQQNGGDELDDYRFRRLTAGEVYSSGGSSPSRLLAARPPRQRHLHIWRIFWIGRRGFSSIYIENTQGSFQHEFWQQCLQPSPQKYQGRCEGGGALIFCVHYPQ